MTPPSVVNSRWTEGALVPLIRGDGPGATGYMDATGTFLSGPYSGTRMLDWALACAERGWHVFPMRQGTKSFFGNCPACNPKHEQYNHDAHQGGSEHCAVHPQGYARCHGLWGATRDPDVIRHWWTENPHANIGINCGRSGIACVDVDIKHHMGKTGDLSLAALEQQYEALPYGPRAVTASGGWHWLFVLPDGEELRSSTGYTDAKGLTHGLADWVDIKANGGLMVAAPSVIYDDKRGIVTGQYTWQEGAELDIPVLPAWVAEEVRRREKAGRRAPSTAVWTKGQDAGADEVGARVGELADEVAFNRGEGGRNNQLLTNARMAFQYAAAGQIDPGEVEYLFMQAGMSCGLGEAECRHTVGNARGYGMAKPRPWTARGSAQEATALYQTWKGTPVQATEDEGPDTGEEKEGEDGDADEAVFVPPVVPPSSGGEDGAFMDGVRRYPPDQMNQARYFCDHDGARLLLRWNLSAGTYMVYDMERGHWRQDDAKHTLAGSRLTELGIRISDATEREVAASLPAMTLKAARTAKIKKEEVTAAKQEINGMRAWAKVYTTAGSHNGILNYTRTIVDHCTALDFDTHSALMNFRNGTYDVRTGQLRAHTMNDMLTHQVGHELDMGLADKPLEEVAPHFHKLVTRMCAAPGEVTPEAHEKRVQAVLRLLGYTLHGSNPEKTMAVFVGGTDIGKNQALEVAGQLLGNQLAWLGARPQLLIEGKSERHDADEYGLAGRRLVLVNEMREGQVLDEGQVLRFVGPEGTQVGLRRMRQDREDHWITWTMCVTTNELPRSRMTPQIINRLTIMQLSQVPVPRSEQYDIKAAILTEEGPAVLAHLVAQWRAWYTAKHTEHSSTGLIRSEEMEESLGTYTESNRPLELEFMDECTERGIGIPLTGAADLWGRFQLWVKEQHPNLRKEELPGRNAFYASIRGLDGQDGVEAVMEAKGGGRFQFRGLRGVRLLPLSVSDMARRYGA